MNPSARAPRFRDLPLLWKFILPFLALMLVAGALGAFFIVRDLSARAERTLDQDLAARLLEVRSRLKDQELYLIESVNLASNLRGIANALDATDRDSITDLMRSVLALKTDVDLLVVTDTAGRPISGFTGSGRRPDSMLEEGSFSLSVARHALREGRSKSSGFVVIGKNRWVAVAAPVCDEGGSCSPVGSVVAGIRVQKVVAGAVASERPDPRGSSGIAIYDGKGRRLASSGRVTQVDPPPVAAGEHVRQLQGSEAGRLATLYSAYELRGEPVGTIAVSIPSAPAFSSARHAAIRLGLILLGVMGGLTVIGLLLSRSFLAQVRPLLETNRALGAGDLGARTPVLGNDELGELAHGFNRMADQLQAGYETLELRVEERTEEIRRLLRDRTEFFAALSHEFRTPLAVILQQVELMLDPSFAHKRNAKREPEKAIRESATQLLAAINDILDLARVETGGLDIDLANVPLQEVVGDLRHTIEGLGAGAGLDVAIEVPEDLPAVTADRTRLKEIIVNLVDNAVKYTPPGGRVELAANASNGVVKVSISDSGQGIPDDEGDRIFAPFYRVKGVEPQGGQPSTGLGLALTKRLVQAHGGEIGFESQVGKGTTFTFTLLRAQETPSDAVSTSATRLP